MPMLPPRRMRVSRPPLADRKAEEGTAETELKALTWGKWRAV